VIVVEIRSTAPVADTRWNYSEEPIIVEGMFGAKFPVPYEYCELIPTIASHRTLKEESISRWYKAPKRIVLTSSFLDASRPRGFRRAALNLRPGRRLLIATCTTVGLNNFYKLDLDICLSPCIDRAAPPKLGTLGIPWLPGEEMPLLHQDTALRPSGTYVWIPAKPISEFGIPLPSRCRKAYFWLFIVCTDNLFSEELVETDHIVYTPSQAGPAPAIYKEYIKDLPH
jgi:hypothetical protein